MKTKVNGMEREIIFKPFFDGRHDDPRKNFGLSPVRIFFRLKGKHGVTEFDFVDTRWFPVYIQEERAEKHRKHIGTCALDDSISDTVYAAVHIGPQVFDLCWYTKQRIHADQFEQKSTDIFEGTDTVYYDYFSLSKGLEVYDTFCEEGEESLWKALEEYYVYVFGELE